MKVEEYMIEENITKEERALFSEEQLDRLEGLVKKAKYDSKIVIVAKTFAQKNPELLNDYLDLVESTIPPDSEEDNAEMLTVLSIRDVYKNIPSMIKQHLEFISSLEDHRSKRLVAWGAKEISENIPSMLNDYYDFLSKIESDYIKGCIAIGIKNVAMESPKKLKYFMKKIESLSKSLLSRVQNLSYCENIVQGLILAEICDIDLDDIFSDSLLAFEMDFPKKIEDMAREYGCQQVDTIFEVGVA